MKKLLSTLFLLMSFIAGQAQTDIPYTELNYNVHYHWGLVDVMIAHGVVTLEKSGDSFTGTLDGNSIPWNGRVFCVSDTLRAEFTPSAAGLPRETVHYINGWYLKPKTNVYRSGSFNPNLASNYKNIKGQGTLDASANTMEAITVTADMLAMFCYAREIDFESMSPGASIDIPVAYSDGQQAESVRVTYNGKSHLKTDQSDYSTYSIMFEYSYKGRMSGYPVKCEVAADTRIPVMFSASLPVGDVEMVYHE